MTSRCCSWRRPALELRRPFRQRLSGARHAADGLRHLHAWAEVFLPGLGWRGLDPTHGLAVSDGHVAIGADPDQRATMPVRGGFYGTGVTSTLAYDVCIEAEE